MGKLTYSDQAGEAAWDPPCGCTDDGLCVFDLSKVGTDTGASDWDELRHDPRYGRRERGETVARTCMAPDEYMRLAAGARGGRIDAEYQSVREAAVEKYAAMMQKGTKFPVPVVEWKFRSRSGAFRDEACCLDTEAFQKLERRAKEGDLTLREQRLLREMRAAVSQECGRLRGSQEGRHRALAAKALGVRRIPVLVQLPISRWTWEKGQTLDGRRRRG